jgi:peptide/nickel transport system ATP-binding protein
MMVLSDRPSAAASMRAAPLLEVEDLATHFFTRAGVVKAVDGVSFSLRQGQVLGLVGESGSGKSVTGYSILGLVDPPGRIVRGAIRFEGRDLTQLSPAAMKAIRGRRISMVFQDATATLNPVLTIGDQMLLAVQAHERLSGRAARALMIETLAKVGIPDPVSRVKAYPHQLSGGMRQRVAIAIALLHRPALIVADEPTTALDVSVQAQIIHEMRELVRRSDTAMIWITHDLATVSSLADHIMVMYAGKMVEAGPTRAILKTPRHPYTRGLLDSVPSRNPRGAPLPQIPGSTPSLLRLSAGCAFAPRCAYSTGACRTAPETVTDGAGALRCHNPAGLAA